MGSGSERFADEAAYAMVEAEGESGMTRIDPVGYGGGDRILRERYRPVSRELVYTKQASKDAKKLKSKPLAKRAKVLLELLREDPFTNPPPFEALVEDLKGAYSRRINILHRLVYEVFLQARAVQIMRLWTYYE